MQTPCLPILRLRKTTSPSRRCFILMAEGTSLKASSLKPHPLTSPLTQASQVARPNNGKHNGDDDVKFSLGEGMDDWK